MREGEKGGTNQCKKKLRNWLASFPDWLELSEGRRKEKGNRGRRGGAITAKRQEPGRVAGGEGRGREGAKEWGGFLLFFAVLRVEGAPAALLQ